MLGLLPAQLHAQRTAPQLREDLPPIGCAECSDARRFDEVLAVDVGPGGAILVVDNSPPMVRLFDHTGRLTWAVGTKGAGPGEFRLPIAARLLDDGSVVVIDMTLRRITHLHPDGRLRSTTPIGQYVGAASIDARGLTLLASDDFVGALRLLEWSPGTAVRSVGALQFPAERPRAPMPSIARATDGRLAAVLVTDYEIMMRAADASTRDAITRDVERVRRTQREEDELQERLQRRGAQLRGVEDQARGGSSTAAASRPRAPGLKMHFAGDALRFDAASNLWVSTQRGGDTTTVLDIFDSRGAFRGPILVHAKNTVWTIANGWFVSGSLNADDYLVVRRWKVTER